MNQQRSVTYGEITNLASPDQKTGRLEAALKSEREVKRTGDYAARSQAQHNIEKIEMWLENSRQDDKVRADREHARQADKSARIKQQRDDLEQQLMDDYVKASPGTTDAEAKAALPDLLHRHRLAEIDRQEEHLADARRRISRVAL